MKTGRGSSTAPRQLTSFDAIILGGGRGRRLGGRDKSSLRVGDRTFISRARDSVREAKRVVFVGPASLVPEGLETAEERPPGGGPVAAIAAGLERISAQLVVVRAVDYPLVDQDIVAQLVSGVGEEVDGIVLTDDGGRDQPLAGCYRAASLRSALERMPSAEGAAVRDLIAPLLLQSLRSMPAALDADTAEDLERIESYFESPK
jgi:molybdopterin-guanine dinucleotide biosynthesis protein A